MRGREGGLRRQPQRQPDGILLPRQVSHFCVGHLRDAGGGGGKYQEAPTDLLRTNISKCFKVL